MKGGNAASVSERNYAFAEGERLGSKRKPHVLVRKVREVLKELGEPGT